MKIRDQSWRPPGSSAPSTAAPTRSGRLARGLRVSVLGVLLAVAACSSVASSDTTSDALILTNDDGGIFACGGTPTCDGRSQVCEHVEGGPAPGVDFYACIPIPAACDSDVSCPCVTNALRGRGAGECSASGSNVTVQIDVP
jgi:hypothetical protein